MSIKVGRTYCHQLNEKYKVMPMSVGHKNVFVKVVQVYNGTILTIGDEILIDIYEFRTDWRLEPVVSTLTYYAVINDSRIYADISDKRNLRLTYTDGKLTDAEVIK